MNIIPKIAEMLGMKIGEEFKVTKYNNVVFRFDETSLQFYSSLTNEWRETSDEFYKMIMKGDTEVERLPFEPKDGEPVWVVNFYDENKVFTLKTVWHDTMIGYSVKHSGNCFRTEAEAEAHKYEIYEKLTGRKWEEKDG